MTKFVLRIAEFLIECYDAMKILINITLMIFIPVALCFGLIVACDQTEYSKRHREEANKRRIAEETPHVIRQADDCKVYEFKAGGHLHYFTRCPRETFTDTTIEERHGKRSDYRIESQVMENY